MPTLFEKICQGEIPADIVYEDEHCLCFRDIAPQAPAHLLLVPRKPIPRIAEAATEYQSVLGHMMTKISHIARSEGLEENGFRVVINNGRDGGEAVPHLHIHILGGRAMTWPPG
jgi:histidine triad (HIT) family protein